VAGDPAKITSELFLCTVVIYTKDYWLKYFGRIQGIVEQRESVKITDVLIEYF